MTRNIFSFLKTPLFNSPWGNYNGNSSGPWGKGSQKPQEDLGQKPSGNSKPNQSQKINQSGDPFEGIKNFFKNNFGGNGSNGGSNNIGGKNPKSLFGLFLTAIFLIWMASGIYKVDSDENGLVMYFGKFYSISTPGLNYHLPYPFGKVIKKSVIRVNTEEFSSTNEGKTFLSRRSQGSNFKNSDNLMLTGDENIVDIDFQVQWQISDIKDFVFNLENPEVTIRKASISAIREIIAKSPIVNALSDGKSKIEQETKTLLQQILDSYGAGVRIVLVQMLRVDPPSQVIDAFRDVQTAKADKEREINQAQAYRNDIIPRAKGEVAKIVEGAKAYKQEVIAEAQGQASRFNALYSEYAKSRAVTKKRLYIEQMERTYRDIDKVIIDQNISKTGAIPYLPIGSKQIKKGE